MDIEARKQKAEARERQA